MAFDRRDIRRGMDVYTRDGAYLGVVRHITAESRPPAPPISPPAAEHGDGSGELLGPVPTRSIGNSGPRTQGAAARYATDVAIATPDIVTFEVAAAFRPWRGRRFSADDVRTISMERVVLARTTADLAEP